MAINKSIVSYFLWIIYTIAALAGLWAFASLICVKTGYGAGYGLAAGTCVLVAEAAACAIFHTIGKRRKLQDKSKQKKINLKIAEGVAAVILLAVNLAVYIVNMPGSSSQSVYYDAAVVKSGSVISFDGDIIEFLYLKALNAMFFVLGNKMSAAMAFQIAVAMISLILIYFALRRLAGAVPGLTMLIFMAASGAFVSMIFNIEPDIFRFFVFSLGLFITASCSNSALALAEGFYIGFFAGDCAVTATLVIIAFGCIIYGSAGKIYKIIYKAVYTLVGVCGGLAAYFALYAYFNGVGFDKAVSVWINALGILNINMEQYGWLAVTGYEAAALQVVICLGIFTFWVNKKSYLSGMWLVQFICMAVLAAAAKDELYIMCAVYLIMTVMAGIAVRNLTEPVVELHGGRHTDKNPDIEFANIESGNAEFGNNETTEDNGNGEAKNMAENGMSGTPGRTVTVNVDGKDRQIKLLDNPLTLPKKKEHKTMDYDYEVSDDDDFDI